MLPLNRTIIPGPPGTGKTYRLINHHLANELITTDPSKIIYISFSNAAANEARKRIEELYPSKDIVISTLHSLGTRELEINTNTQLLQGNNWNGFKNYSQICKDLEFETITGDNGVPEYRNNYMKVIEYAKSKKITELEDAALELDIIDSIDMGLCQQIKQDLDDYKRDFTMYEFSDMISEFVKKDKCPSLDVVFLDEAQDLSPLQWDMFFYIESRCKRSYIAGDDDQTIYSFQGADPTIFINLEGTLDPQEQSRRVPRSVHRVAMSILSNVEQRRDKVWIPRDAEGEVVEDAALEHIDFSKGNWMILTRTNNQMKPIVEHMLALGHRFNCKYNPLLPLELIEAINIWDRLNKGASVSASEAQLVYEYLTYKNEQVKFRFSGGKSLEGLDTVDLDELMLNHGLQVTGSWELLNIEEEQKLYIKDLLERGEDLSQPSRIKISTIHGVKGEQCDNVILFTDLEKIIYDSALRDKDTEHRLFFVGVTRAKETLYIMNHDYDYQYNIGEEII
jgi:superfamily I DNA/RNA helicase|tara:strand:+ start:1004 stop:2527 length:1524 start_codon:yes stop_codon:yes gene_type:complete